MAKAVAGFPNYSVTEKGTITNTLTGKECGKEVTRLGYVRVKIKGPEGWKKKLVHRLVLETFNPSAGLEVNHINGDKSNNCLTNLEWVSRSGNVRHAYKSGLKVNKKGPRGSIKLLPSEIELIRDLRSDLSARSIATLFGVSPSTINLILRS